ncbi:MAG TPA: hypothetical protein VGQ09_12120 [Chitinophagaceae bacterium]|jgi:hypothetical protein|nr:hypothetical protein [Chitinophagaceae bacterium]
MKRLVSLIATIAIATFLIAANAQDTSMIVNDAYTTSKTKNNTYGDHGNVTLDKSFIWSIGIEPSIPVGHFHDYAGFGFGASLQGEIKPGKNVGITINAGYIAYPGKTVDSFDYSNFKYWPVMGGLKIYMGKAYLHGQAGAGFGTEGLGTSFWYGAGLGINFSKRIDAELRYAGWKQQEIFATNGNGGIYGGSGNGGNGGDGGGGGYGGHYSTIGLRLAVNF